MLQLVHQFSYPGQTSSAMLGLTLCSSVCEDDVAITSPEDHKPGAKWEFNRLSHPSFHSDLHPREGALTSVTAVKIGVMHLHKLRSREMLLHHSNEASR